MSRLPVIQPTQSIRPSRSTRWRAAVLIAVHVAIAAHVTYWLAKGRTTTPVEPSEAAAFANAGVINTGFVFFAVTIVLTAVFGRFFCGWACHLVALQDLARGLLERLGRKPKPLRSRLLRWVPAIAFVYAFLWPFIYRWIAGHPNPEIQTEFTTGDFWATFPGWIVGGLTFLICGFVAIYFLGAKGFCTYACPYGAAFAAAERVSPMRIRVTDACAGCGHCTAVCTSNVRVHEEVRDYGMVVDSGCMKCLDCVSVCPNDALYYGAGPLPLFAEPKTEGRKMNRYPLSWAEEAVLALGFAAALFTFRGLYGQVPFLMALGLAGVLAYLVLLSFQVVTRPNVKLKAWRLRHRGRLQPAAGVLLAGMAVLLAFWAHSGVVRFHAYRGDAGFRAAKAWQTSMLDVSAQRPRLAQDDKERIERGYSAFEDAGRLGLMETHGRAAKMAWQAAVLGRTDSLERHASVAIERGELAAEMHQLLGRAALEAGQAGVAVDQFSQAADVADHDVRPRINLGIALAQNGRLDQARSTFETARQDFGENVALAYNLGLIEAYSGRIDLAATHFARAVELNPRHLPARENLAGMLATLGRFEESAAQYAIAVEQVPNDPQTRVLYARVLSALGRYDEALVEVRAALRLSPDLAEARRMERELAGI